MPLFFCHCCGRGLIVAGALETERRNVGIEGEIAARAQSALAGVRVLDETCLLYSSLCYRLNCITVLYCNFPPMKPNVFHYGTSYIENGSF